MDCHGQTLFWFTNANQKRAPLGRVRCSNRLSPDEVHSHLRQHRAVVGHHGGQGDAVHPGGEQPGGLAPFEPEGQAEGGVDQPEGVLGRRRGKVLQQGPRDGLPLGRLQRGGRLGPDLEPAPGLHGDEPALEIDLQRRHAPAISAVVAP